MLNKKEWLQCWKKALVDSGYYFFMNVKYIESQLTECEMKELLPEESAGIYIETAKEFWNMSEDEYEEINQLIAQGEGASENANKSGG